MTQAIVPIQRTEMGQLVENREDLAESVRVLSKRLRNLPPWSLKFEQAQRERNLADRQRNIKGLRERVEELRRKNAVREEALLHVTDPDLHAYIEKWSGGGHGPLPEQINSAEQQIADMEEAFDSVVAGYEAHPLVDPHIEAAEALATVETALADTKAHIDMLRKEARKDMTRE